MGRKLVNCVVTKTPFQVVKDLKEQGYKSYVCTIWIPKGCEYPVFNSFADYFNLRDEISKESKPIICEPPFYYTGDIKVLDMDFSYMSNLNLDKPVDIDWTQAISAGSIKRKPSVDLEVVHKLKPESVIDKIHSFIYKSTSNKNRKAVRSEICTYIVFDVYTKEALLNNLESLKIKHKEGSEQLLSEILDMLDSEKGINFRKTCRQAKEEEGQGGLSYDKVAAKYGVDKFDVKTVLLNTRDL